MTRELDQSFAVWDSKDVARKAIGALMTKTLWDLQAGEQGRVKGFRSVLEDAYRVRLMELGFHPGEDVVCTLVTGMGAPRLYRVHHAVYSLDDQVATQIEMESEDA